MNDKEKKPGNPWTKSLLIWAGVLFALILFVQMIDGGARTATGQAIPYSEFVRQVDDGNVRTVTMASGGTTGNSQITGKLDSGEVFHTVAPAGTNVADRMVQKGVAVQVKADEQGSIWLLHALQFAAVPADPRHQLLRHAADAEERRFRRDGLRQEPRADADRRRKAA